MREENCSICGSVGEHRLSYRSHDDGWKWSCRDCFDDMREHHWLDTKGLIDYDREMRDYLSEYQADHSRSDLVKLLVELS